jgi:ribosome biogenesis GTPase / thiamine phosphate phosphatase
MANPSATLHGAEQLSAYGWEHYRSLNPELADATSGMPARVVAQHRGSYELMTENGVVRALVVARLRRSADPADRPVVGDWVIAVPAPNADLARIEAVLRRTSAFTRANPGGRRTAQVLATNLDTVFIVDTLDRPLNLRRLERYLVVAWKSGAAPVLALSKADLCEDVPDAVAEAATIAAGAPVIAYSALTGAGLTAIADRLHPGHTAAMIGPSGVGKSTLINRFLDGSFQQVGPTREFDGKGRHTTSGRNLLLAPSGVLFIDTPGLRELQLWESDEGLEHVFSDIDDVAASCRFSNCTHNNEPGCAIIAAIDRGELDPERLLAYLKLDEEAAADEARREAQRMKLAIRDYNEVKRRTVR